MSAARTLTESRLKAEADAEQARAMEMQRMWSLYDAGPTRPLEPTRDATGKTVDDNTVPNMCAVVVDKGVSFLFGGEVEFAVSLPGDEADGVRVTDDDAEDSDDDENPVEAALEEFWRLRLPSGQVGKTTFLQRLALSGGVTGQACVRLVDRKALGLAPRLVALDPAYLTIFTNEDDHELVEGYKLQYDVVRAGAGEVTKRILIEPIGDPSAPTAWRETTYESTDESKTWHLAGEPYVWPYPFPPIVTCQNLPAPHEVWGRSDLAGDVPQLNEAQARVLSHMAKTIRHYGNPTTIFSGVSREQIGRMSLAIGDALALPGENAKAANLEMASDLAASSSVYRLVKDAIHEGGRVPRIATGEVENIGQLSALALGILYGPLMEKTEVKRGLYGDLLVEVSRRALYMMGHTDDGIVIQVSWPNPLPKSELEDAQTAIALESVGVSKETNLERLGFDPAVEAQRRQDEAAEALANGQAALGDDLNAPGDEPPAPGQQQPGQQPPAAGPQAKAA